MIKLFILFIKRNAVYLLYGCMIGAIIGSVFQRIRIEQQSERISLLTKQVIFITDSQVALFEAISESCKKED